MEKRMRTVKVSADDFKIKKYLVVNCPYCGEKMLFSTIFKFIDKIGFCTECGNEFRVKGV